VNFYNDNDETICLWARELIRQGHAPAGTVDCRDIREVRPADLAGYAQCHFFGGILGWPYALRLAGWPTDRKVWTGSVPCQPFSAAGKRKGTADERHLWPAFLRLIAECRPATVFGEQVASRLGREWLAGVRTDLENLGYAVGTADLPACCAGAPHIRQRLYWVADAKCWAAERYRYQVANKTSPMQGAVEKQWIRPDAGNGGPISGLPDAQRDGGRLDKPGREAEGRTADFGDCEAGGLQHTESDGWEQGRPESDGGSIAGGCGIGGVSHASNRQQGSAQTTGRKRVEHITDYCRAGFWTPYDIIPFRDGKSRRVERGAFPLVAGLPRGMVHGGDPITTEYALNTAEARVLRLKGYGNSIVPQVAAAFIRAYCQATGGPA